MDQLCTFSQQSAFSALEHLMKHPTCQKCLLLRS